MPDEPKKPETKEPETKPVTAAVDEEKLAAAIAKGLSADRAAREEALKAERPATSAPAPLPPIEDVSDDDIEAAREAGDKTKVRELTAKQRKAMQAKLERETDAKLAIGVAAINQLSEQSVAGDPWFKKYEREVRSAMAEWQARNPGAIATADHWKAALRLIKGDHTDDIQKETREETIRQQREASAPAAPGGDRTPASEPEEKEYKNLTEAFGPGFEARFREKQRTVGTRTEDEEVRMMDRWFRNKMPNNFAARDEKGNPTKHKPVETAKDYIKEAQEIDKIAAEDPSLGLGS